MLYFGQINDDLDDDADDDDDDDELNYLGLTRVM